MNQQHHLSRGCKSRARSGLIAALWLLWAASPKSFAQDAWWSVEGDFQNATDEVHLSFTLVNPVSSAEAFWLQTFGYAGGTNAAGDPVAAGGFDPIVALYDVSGGGEVSRGSNDDGGTDLDAWLTWPGTTSGGAITVDPLPPRIYRADLTAYAATYPGGRSPWALDLYGPSQSVALTGLATAGDASVRTLKFGGDLGGRANSIIEPFTSATVTDELVLGTGGEGWLLLMRDTLLATPGTTTIGHNGPGSATVTGLNAQWEAGPVTVGGPLGGSGSVLVTEQSDINSGDVQIGTDSADGSVVIDGTASTGGLVFPARWDVSGSVTTGSAGSGSGTVTIEHSGTMTVTNDVGISGTSSAAASMTVQESGYLQVDGTITVGPNGTMSLLSSTLTPAEIETNTFTVTSGTFDHQDGVLTINGGTFDPGSPTLGMWNDVVIDGATPADLPTLRFINGGSVLLPFGQAQSAIVGSTNRGKLEILSGSEFNITSSALGVGIGGSSTEGEVIVEGDGSSLTTLSGVILGGGVPGGNGILRIRDGGAVSVVETTTPDSIAGTPGSTGTLEVSGTNSLGTVPSSYITGRELQVGLKGQGTLLIGDGGVVSTGSGFIARRSDSTNSVATVDGSGPTGPSTWNISGSLYVGGADPNVGSGGTGTLMVANGGFVGVAEMLKVWNTGTVELLGSEIHAGTFSVESGATFTHADGTLTVDGGEFDPGVSSYNLDSSDPNGLAVLRLINGASASLRGSRFYVAQLQRARLEILAGSSVNVPDSDAFLDLATAPGSRGEILVEGKGSNLTTDAGISVGTYGEGSLRIQNGGSVNDIAALSSGNGPIGWGEGSRGFVEVVGEAPDGTASTWTTHNVLEVGWAGVGELTIADGGRVNALDGAAIAWHAGISDGSRVTVEGIGSVNPSTWEVIGELYVGGHSSGDGGTGSLTVANGGLVIADQVNVLSPGVLVLEGGVLSTASLQVDGHLLGDGVIELGPADAVTNRGIIAPGFSAGSITVIGGEYLQDPNGSLQIEIGGLIPGVEFDTLVVTGEGGLDGTLEVALIDPNGGSNLFIPNAGDSFEILTAGELWGTFASELFPAIPGKPGLEWLIDYDADADRVLLSVTPIFEADFDEDGDVDGADLVLWEAGYGVGGGASHDQGDANRDLRVDGLDFLIWQQQCGSAVPVSRASTAVPEPGTCLLALVSLCIAVSRRRVA